MELPRLAPSLRGGAGFGGVVFFAAILLYAMFSRASERILAFCPLQLSNRAELLDSGVRCDYSKIHTTAPEIVFLK
jgi:hypothetical protein